MDKTKAWFKHSLTILWARIVALTGVLLAVVPDLLGDQNLSSAVQAALSPKYLPLWIIGIGLVTEFARRRTAGKP